MKTSIACSYMPLIMFTMLGRAQTFNAIKLKLLSLQIGCLCDSLNRFYKSLIRHCWVETTFAVFSEAHKIVFNKCLLTVRMHVCISHDCEKPQENLHCI